MPWALLSVSDKTGIVGFAQQLIDAGYSLLASGGTGALLAENQLAFVEVSEVTEFPEIMAGRVKTLHPKIHGGILARRDIDQSILEQHHIPLIDLVIVNLYPFEQTLQQHPQDYQKLVEHIDVGGPAMIRAAAKNHRWVSVITDPQDYLQLGHQLQAGEAISSSQKQRLAQRAFALCAHYDRTIEQWLMSQCNDTEPTATKEKTLTLTAQHSVSLRYGENPHQTADLYLFAGDDGWNSMQQHHGKPLSYNNIVDSETALRCVNDLDSSACVIVKHANPCGVACDDNLTRAYTKAFQSDPESAFGGIAAFNRPIDAALVASIVNNQFIEVILAPAVSQGCVEALLEKPNVRLISLTLAASGDSHIRSVAGGLLIQQDSMLEPPQHQHASGPLPTANQIEDINNAWKIVKHVKSNAIVIYKDDQTLGIGAGQTSRIQSLRIAIAQAQAKGFDTHGAIMASDAFLPFADSVEYAAEHGISHIIQTGGSMRDQSVIDAAEQFNIGMTLTGLRCFFH